MIEILPFRVSRVIEVYVRVDPSRKHAQALGIYDFFSAGGREAFSDFMNFLTEDAYIGANELV